MCQIHAYVIVNHRAEFDNDLPLTSPGVGRRLWYTFALSTGARLACESVGSGVWAFVHASQLWRKRRVVLVRASGNPNDGVGRRTRVVAGASEWRESFGGFGECRSACRCHGECILPYLAIVTRATTRARNGIEPPARQWQMPCSRLDMRTKFNGPIGSTVRE